jgi:hypothetical protein
MAEIITVYHSILPISRKKNLLGYLLFGNWELGIGIDQLMNNPVFFRLINLLTEITALCSRFLLRGSIKTPKNALAGHKKIIKTKGCIIPFHFN